MDDFNKNRIKNLVVYTACSFSLVSIYGISVNLSKESNHPMPIILTGCVLSIVVPRVIKKVFIDEDDKKEDE